MKMFIDGVRCLWVLLILSFIVKLCKYIGSYFTFLVIIVLDQFLKCLTIYLDIEIDQFDLQMIKTSIHFKLFNLKSIGYVEAYHWILYQ